MIKTPMTPDGEIDWAAFEDDVDELGRLNAPTKKPNAASKDAKVHKFPCQGCGGSGLWRGRGKCFACGGKGYFLTSQRQRDQAKVNRQASKARKQEDAYAAFAEANPEVVAFLRKAATWQNPSEFCLSMIDNIKKWGSLTEKQLVAVQRMMARAEERRLAWQAERNAGAQEIDLSPIRRMFEAAVASGYKSPVYRAAGLVISRAPDHGRNPGALYVVQASDDQYLGKIVGTSYSGKLAEGLTAIAADPRGEAVKYGQKTGNCSCCGRTLTAEGSVSAGIGPICAEKWNL